MLDPVDEQPASRCGPQATVVITGSDAAGNLSLPLSQAVVVDTVAPALTVLQLLTETVPVIGTQPAALLEGTYSDGGGLAEIYARLQGPAGNRWTAVQRTPTAWHFAPELPVSGLYTITLQAYDQAGNSSSYGPFHLLVQEDPTAVTLNSITILPAHFPLLPLLLLLALSLLFTLRHLAAAAPKATAGKKH